MKYGLFMMPLHEPGQRLADTYDRDLDTIVRADQLGYSEAWIGEHFTNEWENLPAPDLLIAKALPLTQQIVLATGVVVLPFHDPVIVAHRIAALDHLAHGRFAFGIGSGGVPTDFRLFGVDVEAGEHRSRTREAIEIILKVWAGEPFEYHGKHFNVRAPEPEPNTNSGLHVRPYQQPYPPIAVAGLHPYSETLAIAGDHGWIPMSINFMHVNQLHTHWDMVERGASRSGRRPSRQEWRIARDVHVAETTEQAKREAREGAMARVYDNYLLKVTRDLGVGGIYKADPERMTDAEVTIDYLIDNVWIVGSPDDCAAKLRHLYEAVGGFGTLLTIAFDMEPRETWIRSMELFANKVMPRLKDLMPND